MSSTKKSLATGFAMSEPIIAVLIPTRGTLFTATVAALDRELSRFKHVRYFTVDLPIPHCRNALVEQAQASGLPFTHYLMVDDDVVSPEGGLQAMLDTDADIAIIDYPTHNMGKHGKNGNVAYDSHKPGKKALWAGLGCTLVKASVFDDLEKPYFRSGGAFYDQLRDGKKVLYGARIQSAGGEDYEFYTDCRKNGHELAVVPGMVAGHAKIMRHIGVLEQDKYVKQHDILIADEIERQAK